MRATRRRPVVGLSLVIVGLLVLTPTSVLAITTDRDITLLSGDWPAASHVQGVRMSADGQVMAFSADPAVVPFGMAGSSGYQVFVWDESTQGVEQVSVNPDGTPSRGNAFAGGLSGDGRFVTYTDYNEFTLYLDVYLRDRLTQTTELISVDQFGGFADTHSRFADVDVSDDGRFIVFVSDATDLVADDLNGKADVFLRDRVMGTTTLLSVGPGGDQADGASYGVTMSTYYGRIAFASDATNLLGPGGDGNGATDIFVADVPANTIERVSVPDGGGEANSGSGGCGLSLSADGQTVAFTSAASNLLAGSDTNFAADVFVRDLQALTTVRASVTDAGGQTQTSYGNFGPAISDDGTKVAFGAQSPLDAADTNPGVDVYLRDLAAGTTELISRTAAGVAGNDPSGDCLNGPGIAIDGSGDVVAFASRATDLTSDPPDDPGVLDVYVSRLAAVDADGDGIADDLDANPGSPSGAFSDGTTFGQIVSIPAGFTVSVSDAADSGAGVHIVITGTGTQKVQFLACGLFTVFLPAGTDAVFTCGSVIVSVAPGSPPVEIVFDDGLATVSVPAGAEAEIDQTPVGGFSVENVSGGSVEVTVDGVVTSVDPGETLTGNAWDFQGFGNPIDNLPSENVAKAGKTIPVKWRIVGADGRPITDLAGATLSIKSLACPLGATPDQVEVYTTESSGFHNLGDGNYQVNWRTLSSFANSCKTMELDIGDGVLHEALFKFTK